MMRFARRPHINWTRRRRVRCGLCRRRAGPLFDVPDAVWLFYVTAEQRYQLLCIRCWHRLVDIIDGGAFEGQHGGPVPLWSDEFRRRHDIPADVAAPQLPPWFSITDEQAQPPFARRCAS